MMLELGFSLSILIQAYLFARGYRSLDERIKTQTHLNYRFRDYYESQIGIYKRPIGALQGLISKLTIQSKIATKTADRAFNLASSANIGNAIIAKTLQSRPRTPTRENLLENDLVKKKIEDQFNNGGDFFDYLRPTLSNDEIEALETIQERAARKGPLNGRFSPS
jgi:hypothetical protein